jgi:hypothetical protein
MAARYTLVVTGGERSAETGAETRGTYQVAKWTEPQSAMGESFWKVIAACPSKLDAMVLLGDLKLAGADVQTS